MAKQNWSVYLIEAANKALYCGITTDVERRFQQHKTGKGAKYFRTQAPVKVVFSQSGFDRSLASQLEMKIKKLSRPQKLAVVSGLIEIESL